MLDAQRPALIEAAVTARQLAYAPYSKFAVGAALLASDGRLFSGCNVENVSYGLTVCGERTSLFSAVANGARDFLALAIATSGGHTPCGACRQVLAEFCTDLEILLVDTDDGQFSETTLGELLPRRFG